MIDQLFYLTLLFIFVSALVGVIVQRWRRDPCLKDFEGFLVTVELASNKTIWGRLTVFPNGIELFYADPHPNVEGHVETSFVLYQQEYDQIRCIYRYHDELDVASQALRRDEIRRTYHPSLRRRTMRVARNLLNIFADAIRQSLGTTIAQAKKSGGAGAVLQTQGKQIESLGVEFLDVAASRYEPILERYIGRRVVVEERQGDGAIEYAGILKEYTQSWIELLDCRVSMDHSFALRQPEQLQANSSLQAKLTYEHGPEQALHCTMTFTNTGTDPYTIKRVVDAQDYVVPIDAAVSAGESISCTVTKMPAECLPDLEAATFPLTVALTSGTAVAAPAPNLLPDVSLVVEAQREADRCLPRRSAVLRHGGEPLRQYFWRWKR